VQVSSSSLSLSSGDVVDGHQWEVQTLSAGFCTGPVAGVELTKEAFTSRAR
jgi:hypothetical protein